nr:hypothetical protein [Aliamphritea spongicola]
MFKGVIQEAHLCVEAFVGLANAHRAIGERRVALDLLRQATLIQPTSPLLQAALGKIALHEGNIPLLPKRTARPLSIPVAAVSSSTVIMLAWLPVCR